MPNRTLALVSQYLEKISSRALEKYVPVIRGLVGRRNGVYALYKGHRLYYVGLATNLRTRLRHHLQDRHRGAWDTFSVYLTVGDDHLRELEALVIRIASPKGNSQKGGFKKAENLSKTFLRLLKNAQQREISQMISLKPAPQAATDTLSASDVPLRAYSKKSFSIKFNYKKQTRWATVRRDGRIRYDGKIFDTPSGAATHIRGGKATNGWVWWLFERAPSDWVTLDTLRR